MTVTTPPKEWTARRRKDGNYVLMSPLLGDVAVMNVSPRHRRLAELIVFQIVRAMKADQDRLEAIVRQPSPPRSVP